MHLEPTHLIDLTAMAFVLAAAWFDLRTHRIPNVLCAGAALAGLSLQIWTRGAPGLLFSSAGLAAGLGMFLPFFLLRGFGAGDVKAMGTVGVLLGAKLTVLAAALTLIAGSVLGLLVACVSQVRERRRFPYGPAIAVGALIAVLWAGRMP